MVDSFYYGVFLHKEGKDDSWVRHENGVDMHMHDDFFVAVDGRGRWLLVS